MKPQKPDHYHSTNIIGREAKRAGPFTERRSGFPEEIRVFDVVLEAPNQIFFSGNVINGQVRIDLDNCLTLQGIMVRFVGEAYVSVPDDSDRWGVKRHIQQLRPNFCTNKISPSMTDTTVGGSCCGGGGEQTLDYADCCSDTHEAGNEEWTKNKARHRMRQYERQIKIRAHEKYFDNKVYVYGHKYSSRREQLWAGSHTFPFTFTLPPKLPTSFHGRHGYVRYFCEVTLQRALEPNIQRRAYFTVSNHADINTDSKAESSYDDHKSTNSCLFCCQKGTVMVSASIRRRGYVPGEVVLVFADILNMSNRAVRRSCATLRQVVTYISSKGTRRHVDEPGVCEVHRGPIPSGESDSWEGVGVPIPPLPPSSRYNNWCKLMEVDYRLDFAVDIDGEPSPLELKMPLCLGTVPLTKEFNHLLHADASAATLPDTEAPRPVVATLARLHKNLPTVFNEPCVWGPRPVDTYYYRQVPRLMDHDVQSTRPLNPLTGRRHEHSFAPRYACYRLQDTPPLEDRGNVTLVRSLPEIIISTPHEVTGKEAVVAEAARRHSAPAHLVTPTKSIHEKLKAMAESVLADEILEVDDILADS